MQKKRIYNVISMRCRNKEKVHESAEVKMTCCCSIHLLKKLSFKPHRDHSRITTITRCFNHITVYFITKTSFTTRNITVPEDTSRSVTIKGVWLKKHDPGCPKNLQISLMTGWLFPSRTVRLAAARVLHGWPMTPRMSAAIWKPSRERRLRPTDISWGLARDLS